MSARVGAASVALGALAALLALVPGGPRATYAVALALVALLLALSVAVPATRGPWRRLRRSPLAVWSALVVVLPLALGVWIVEAQPVWGKALTRSDFAVICALAVLALAPFAVAGEPGAAARLRGSRARALLALTSFLAAFFGIELALRVACVRPDGFAVTAMHRAWTELHWKPINSLRYRDREPREEPGTKRVLVVGDSFAAGHGIEELDDTFASVLGRELGPLWRVHVAARPGWSSDAEYAAIVKYPLAPDVVVLSYYVNDASYLLGKGEQALAAPPRALEWFASGFFSTSWVYWHVLRGGLDAAQEAQGARQMSVYDDAQLWEVHAADLARFVELARTRAFRLCVVVWPRLDDVESSRAVTVKVGELFRRRGVAVLDLTPTLSGRQVSELVLNRDDAHPSRALHAEVGRALAPLVRGP